MKVSKKIISVLLVLQIGFVSSMPAFAQKKIDNFTNENSYVVEESSIDASLENESNAKRVIVKFKNYKGKKNFEKAKNKKAKKGIKKNEIFETDDRSYAVVELEEDFSVDNFSENMIDEYGDSIDIIQEDYLISFFSNEENEIADELVNEEINNETDNTSQNKFERNLQDETVSNDTSNDTSTIVAVIDTGIDITHQSFSDSIYSNQTETIDGIDNDGNGYVDDVCGWDFINSTALTDTQLDSNHGTHITGLIAENISKNAKILPLKVFENGTAYTSDIIKAIEYAENAGAKIVNCSWGTASENPALEDAIQNSNMLFVCAAGNSAIDISENPIYPASYEMDNIISVGASNDRDYFAYFSNHGSNVDLVANGYEVQSTFVNDNFGKMSGTSMSAAYVTGAAAAVYTNSAYETKQIILNSCDRISTLTDKICNGRRLNIGNALSGIAITDITENTNIDYKQEHMNEVKNQYEGFELYDLDSETVQIATGMNHSLTLSNWGDVYSYGDNTYKQLGLQYGGDTYFWIKSVEGLYNIEEISTFGNHSLALDSRGNVYAWGQNNRYQTGNTSSSEYIELPVKVDFFNSDGSVTTIVDIEAGGWFSLALDSNGNVWGWGDNTYGQIATGYTGYRLSTPRIILTGVSAISAGKYHALAIKDGKAYGWGRNAEDYPLGENVSWSQSTPTQINGLTGVTVMDIEAGDRCSFFNTSEGLYVMGLNNNGQLGDGTTVTRGTPMLLNITVDDIESNGSTLFKCDGNVYACGSNTSGQLGQGYANTRIETPVKVAGSDFDQIAAGGSHNLMFKVNENFRFDEWYYRNATIYAMGDNSFGQCIAQTIQGYIDYPTIVEEVQNTEDTGEFIWNDNNLRPIDSTYVSQDDDTTNFYNEDIKVNYTNTGAVANGYGEYAYLKFDVSNITKEHIKSAKLNVYVKGGDTRQSTREIGVFDTYVNDWNGQTMTWDDGKPGTRSLLGSFTVSANGYLIAEEDLGWHEIDITDYLKNNCIDDKLSLALKMLSNQAHEVVIDSGVYNDNFTFQDMHRNKNIPVLSIEYEPEECYTQQRNTYLPVSDTYVSQYGSDRNMNFVDSEYLGVNYTSDESRADFWGQDSYLAFNLSGMTDDDKKYIKKATLWLYIDETSDIRDSTRIINVSANDGLQYDSSTLTWDYGRVMGEEDIGNFNLTGNGYVINDPGWRQIDVTNSVKSLSDLGIEFILKMTSQQAHPLKIRAMEHSDRNTRPKLTIDIGLSSEQDFIFNENDNSALFSPYVTRAYTLEGMDYMVFDDELNPVTMVNSKYTNAVNGENHLIREYNLRKGVTYTIRENKSNTLSLREVFNIDVCSDIRIIRNLNSISSYNCQKNTMFEFIAPEIGTYEVYTDKVYSDMRFYNSNFEALEIYVTHDEEDNFSEDNSNRMLFSLNKGDKIYFRLQNDSDCEFSMGIFKSDKNIQSISCENTLIYDIEKNFAYQLIPNNLKNNTYIVK